MITPTLRLPLLRVTRTPRAWLATGAWSFFALVAAALIRSRSTHGASDVLQGAVGGVAIPFIAFTLTGAALAGDGLARSTRAIAGFGASRTRAALGEIAVAGAASAVCCAVLAVAVVMIAHGDADPPRVMDAVRSGWIAGLGGAAYASLFSFGASIGKRGWGRVAALVLDAMLASTSVAGMVTPRAHLRSLLGGEAVAEMSARGSAVMLVVLCVGFGIVAAGRARRAR